MNDQTSLLEETRKLLRQYRLHARKGLGQHFLIDPGVLDMITAAAELTPDDIVIEVGPGLGVLTAELGKSARKVIAIEVDTHIISILKKRFSQDPNISVINADVLELDIGEVLESESRSPGSGYKVVANLPYYIAAPTIRRFLEARAKPRCMVLMVQKEVAENIVATPGEMSILAVSVQLYGKPVIVGHVPAASFYPPPKVDSAVLRIDVYDRPAVEVETDGFFTVVKAGFSAPRKQLRNSLAQGLGIDPAAAVGLLHQAGVQPKRRAETLSLEEWADLYRTIRQDRPNLLSSESST